MSDIDRHCRNPPTEAQLRRVSDLPSCEGALNAVVQLLAEYVLSSSVRDGSRT